MLLQPLAQGGMGSLYLAKYAGSAGFERYCVIKTLRRQLTEDPDAVSRFVDEAKVVAQLTHCNISSVFDVGQVEGRYYLAMDYIAGIDAHTLSARALASGRPVPPGMVFHIVGQVLDALDYAHRLMSPKTGMPLGIVHRDISPNNVMISFEGEVKLIDFGLALSSLKNNRTEPNLLVGKVAYMAPEQATGDPVDARADQWAVAVMTYELLTGEEFYSGVENKQQIWMKAALGEHRPPSFPRLEPGLRAVLDRALAKDRKNRFPSCGDMRDSLDEHAFAVGWRATTGQLRKLIEQLFQKEVQQTRKMIFGFSDVEVRPTLEVIGHDRPTSEHQPAPAAQIPVVVGTASIAPPPVTVPGAPLTGGEVPRAVTAIVNVSLPVGAPPPPPTATSAATALAAAVSGLGTGAAPPGPVDLTGGPGTVASAGFSGVPKTTPGVIAAGTGPPAPRVEAPAPGGMNGNGIAPAMPASGPLVPPPQTPSIPEPRLVPAEERSETVEVSPSPRGRRNDATEIVRRDVLAAARAPERSIASLVLALVMVIFVGAALAGVLFRAELVRAARGHVGLLPELDMVGRAPLVLPPPPPPARQPPAPLPPVGPTVDQKVREKQKLVPPAATAPMADRVTWLRATERCAKLPCVDEVEKLAARKKPKPKELALLKASIAKCVQQCVE